MKLSIAAALLSFAFTAAAVAEPPVEITTPELRGAAQPQVAVAPSGNIHAVFGKGNAIYYTNSADGRSFTSPVKIAELEKLALKMRRGPRISATDQVVVITAISHADGNLYAWISTDGGKKFQKQPALNTVARSAGEGLQGMAGDGKGKVAVAWMDNRTGAMQVWARFSADAGATWGPERTVYAAPDGPVCQCCHPSVAFAPSGEVAVMWRNALEASRDMYLRVTRDSGETFTPAQKLGEGTWKLAQCPMDGGSVAAGPDGKWVATWRRDTALFSHPLGAAEERFSEGRQPVIGFAGKHRLILWEQNGALMQLRDGQSSRFAEAGSGAVIVSGDKAATIAWEAGAGGSGGLFVQQMPAQP